MTCGPQFAVASHQITVSNIRYFGNMAISPVNKGYKRLLSRFPYGNVLLPASTKPNRGIAQGQITKRGEVSDHNLGVKLPSFTFSSNIHIASSPLVN